MSLVADRVCILDFPQTISPQVVHELGTTSTVKRLLRKNLMNSPLSVVGFIMNPYEFYVSFYYEYRNRNAQSDELYTKHFDADAPIDLSPANMDNIKADFQKHLRLLLEGGVDHEVVNSDSKTEKGLLQRLHDHIYLPFYKSGRMCKVVKHEQLANDLLRVTHDFDLKPVNLKNLNLSTRYNGMVSDYYSDELKDLVSQYDAEIFALYGYTK